MEQFISNIESNLASISTTYFALISEIEAHKNQVATLQAKQNADALEILRLTNRIKELENIINPPAPEPEPAPAIAFFYVLNNVLHKLENGYRLDAVPTNIVAVPVVDGPVQFSLSGTETDTRFESVAPYALKGDSNGVYNLWTPKPGSYTLTATSGMVIASISFTVDAVQTQPTPTPTPTPTPEGELFFHGKMDNATIANGTLEGWRAPMEALDICRDLYLSYGAQANKAELITFEGKRCLKANLNTPLNGARVQLGVVFTENKSLEVYHFSQEIWLHPDLAHMQQYSGAIGGTPWFVLFETWMIRVKEWAGDPPSRINIGIKKKSGAGSPLLWELRNQYIQPSSLAYTNILPPRENSYPVPFGKWFTLDVVIKTGEGDKGRTTVTLIEGTKKTVLFDVVGTTTYPGRPEITRGTANPIKFYSHDNLINFLLDAGKKVEALFGDFKFYKQ